MVLRSLTFYGSALNRAVPQVVKYQKEVKPMLTNKVRHEDFYEGVAEMLIEEGLLSDASFDFANENSLDIDMEYVASVIKELAGALKELDTTAEYALQFDTLLSVMRREFDCEHWLEPAKSGIAKVRGVVYKFLYRPEGKEFKKV